MNYVTTADNTKLFVKDWGSGRPVILIHGWPLSADSWDDQAVAIANAGYRAIAYDRRGFGRSSQPWTGYDYDTLADDLAAVIEQTDARDAVLVGFSMGGGEVARYMSRHSGASVAQTILIASVLPFCLKTADNFAGTEQAVFDEMAAAMNQDRTKFLTGFFEKFFGVASPDGSDEAVSDELLQWARSVAMQGSLKATLDCLKSFSSTDFRSELSAFAVPTLLIHGTEDKTVPLTASSRLAARGIQGSTLIEYDGAAHGLFATHKDRLSKDMLDFLGR